MSWRPLRTGGRQGRRSPLRLAWDVVLAIAILGLLGLVAARFDAKRTSLFGGTAFVNDGDTLTIAGERIRLLGMDAPELSQTCRMDGKAYPCGRRARDELRAMIGAQQVACRGHDRDRYGRFLVLCNAGGIDLNRALVEDGWAVAFGDYEAEEASARSAGRGLWGGEFDRPRQWRDTHGGMAEAEHEIVGLLSRLLASLRIW